MNGERWTGIQVRLDERQRIDIGGRADNSLAKPRLMS